MVILGNPPYSGHSANKGDWINNLLHGIAAVRMEGALANYFRWTASRSRNAIQTWLNNDYVSSSVLPIDGLCRQGYGVLGFITDHSYLDRLTFRGMRQAFMRDFDEILCTRPSWQQQKKEKAPTGYPDKTYSIFSKAWR